MRGFNDLRGRVSGILGEAGISLREEVGGRLRRRCVNNFAINDGRIGFIGYRMTGR
jgi:hypothetical protein